MSASEEEAVTETERADENVESSYSDDSLADEAKRRKSAEKPKPAPSNRTSPNQAKRRRRNKKNGTRVFRKKRRRIYVDSWK